MTITRETAPWAFIAHKDGKWGGVCAADIPAKEIGKFTVEFIASGFDIKTVFSREQYLAELAKLKCLDDEASK